MMLASDQPAPEDPAGQFRAVTAGFLDEVFTAGDMAVYHVKPESATPVPSADAEGALDPAPPREGP